LALDTTRERLHSAARYLPLLLLDLGAYLLLQQFDVHLWEPGRERVVFRHPRFTFATPICFEDAFPDDIRRFIQAGAGLIMNISNDYWSLTEVEAKQHFINSLFRAVENRRPLLRATASGLTCSVDPQGRLLAALPYYTEGYLLADVAIDPSPRTTFYTRHGDWFPRAAGALVLALILFSATAIFPRPPREKRPREDAPRRAEEPG
jgi:apolipoprotein N-acyltransferase